MTMPRLTAMEREWEKRPSQTTALSFAAQYFGFKVKSNKPSKSQHVGSALELARELQAMG
jgi:hypothetical protein